MTKRFLIAAIFFLCSFLNGLAQDEISELKVSGNFSHTPTEQFITNLEHQYNIHFYYKKEWLDSLTVNGVFDQIPLIQVLNKFFGQGKLSYLFFQNSVVLFPRASVAGEHRFLDEASVLYIGDPINIGRYKEATIKGTVTDGKTGDRLSGAVVYVRDMDEGISTNNRGEFEMQLPTGRHHLKISFVGFEPQQQEIDLIEDGDVVFDLFEETHNLDEIKITGDNTNTSRTQMSMVRMDAREIKKLPVLMGEADVIKSVVMMPGVQSVGELSSGFNVRGGNADQNLVLIDGAPVYNTSHLFGFFSMINPDAVSDVTLYKGGLPASYGDRVASVMDVQLKQGMTDHLQLYGGLGVINSRITLDGPLVKDKKSSFLLGGRSTYSDWILRQTKNLKFRHSIARFYDLNGNVNFHLSDRNNLKLMGYTSSDEFNLNSNSLYQYQNYIGALNWKMALGEKWVSNLNIDYSQYQFRLNETDEYLSELDYELKTGIEYAGLKYLLSFLPNDKIKLNGGFQVSVHRVYPGEILPAQDTSSIQYEKVVNEQAIEYAGFAEGEFDIAGNFAMTLGLRYSRFSNVGPATIYLYDPNFTRSLDHVVDSLVFSKNKVIKTYQGLEPRLSFKYKLNSG
ncbi:MAG TPA: TonB-dependent receptor, partial [Sunxiuqinia sp.]|nr:TonB-dependent receptor [Sunxiuqinia sp.]